MQNKAFIPSELGFIVNDLLAQSFPGILNISFTAGLENQLDDVEQGKMEEIQLLKDFYSPFKENLDTATDEMVNVKGVGISTEINCPVFSLSRAYSLGRPGGSGSFRVF